MSTCVILTSISAPEFVTLGIMLPIDAPVPHQGSHLAYQAQVRAYVEMPCCIGAHMNTKQKIIASSPHRTNNRSVG
jgi:hypothetical protein